MNTEEQIKLISVGHELLMNWGRFAFKKDHNGLGYPGICPTFNEHFKGNGKNYLIPDSIFLTDKLVAEFGKKDPAALQTVKYFYVRAWPRSSCVYYLKYSVRTFRNHLNRACLYIGSRYTGEVKGGGYKVPENIPEKNSRN